MDPRLVTILSAAITEATGITFICTHQQSVNGGDINQAIQLSDHKQSYFIKINDADALNMFITEAHSLAAIRQTNSIRAPRPIAHGISGKYAYLILESIAFDPPSSESWKQMGQQLASLHRHTAEQFGWFEQNTIGSTPQYNGWTANWADFFREYRLQPQLQMADKNGLNLSHTESLLQRVPFILKDHNPMPSLLHGDLWPGNAGFGQNGIPVLFDPASYYGDRETDLAFSELFSGFPNEFYQSYNSTWPLMSSYLQRKPLYNLYHVLNHANLFGGNYIREAQQRIIRLLS
jgi:fructosamine-3-kinase